MELKTVFAETARLYGHSLGYILTRVFPILLGSALAVQLLVFSGWTIVGFGLIVTVANAYAYYLLARYYLGSGAEPFWQMAATVLWLCVASWFLGLVTGLLGGLVAIPLVAAGAGAGWVAILALVPAGFVYGVTIFYPIYAVRNRQNALDAIGSSIDAAKGHFAQLTLLAVSILLINGTLYTVLSWLTQESAFWVDALTSSIGAVVDLLFVTAAVVAHPKNTQAVAGRQS
jgi:hypothetical protein